MSDLSSFRAAIGSVVRDAIGAGVTSHIRRAFADERGGVFAVMAIAIIPLFIAIGIVVDIGRGYLAQSHLSYVLDSAGLADGGTIDGDLYIHDIQTLLQESVDASRSGAKSAFTNLRAVVDDVTSTLTLKAEVTVPTYFLRLAGVDLMTFGAQTVRALVQPEPAYVEIIPAGMTEAKIAEARAIEALVAEVRMIESRAASTEKEGGER